MVLLVLVLVLVWAAVLSPSILRKLSEHRLDISVARFRNGIRRIGHTQAAVVFDGEPIGAYSLSREGLVQARARSADARARSHRRIERRIRTLKSFGIAIVSTVVLGAVPALRPLWYLSLVAVLAGVAYLAMLVLVTRQEMLITTQSRKVVSLPSGYLHRPGERRLLVAAGGQRTDGYSMQRPAVIERRPTFRIVEQPS